MKKHHSICGLGAFLGIIIFVFFLFAAIILYPGYSANQHNLSDLGVQWPSSLFFNIGVIIAGIMLITFFLDIKHVIKKNGSTNLGIWFGIIASVGLIGLGIFTLNNNILHNAFAGIFFVFIGLAAGTLSSRIFSEMSDIYGWSCFVFFGIDLMYLIFLTPVFQKLTVFSFILWAAAISYGMIKKHIRT